MVIIKKKPKEYGVNKKGRPYLTITKQDIIKNIASQTGYYQSDISKIFSVMDDYLKELYYSVDETHDVEIKLFDGIRMNIGYVPEHEASTFTLAHKKGDIIEPSLKFNFKIAGNFKNNITNIYRSFLKEKAENNVKNQEKI